MIPCHCCRHREPADLADALEAAVEPCVCTELYCLSYDRCSTHCCCIVSAGLVRVAEELV